MFLSPLPPGVRGRVRIVTSLLESMIFGKFRPGSGGSFISDFYFDPQYSWGNWGFGWVPPGSLAQGEQEFRAKPELFEIDFEMVLLLAR